MNACLWLEKEEERGPAPATAGDGISIGIGIGIGIGQQATNDARPGQSKPTNLEEFLFEFGEEKKKKSIQVLHEVRAWRFRFKGRAKKASLDQTGLQIKRPQEKQSKARQNRRDEAALLG